MKKNKAQKPLFYFFLKEFGILKIETKKAQQKSEAFETKNVSHFLSMSQAFFVLAFFVRSIFLSDFCSKFITK